MSDKKPTSAARKKAMLSALEKSLGVVTPACRAVGVDRATHYRWMETDLKYKEAVIDIENVALDFVESKLHKSIESGSDPAMIFYLKTKGKKRGYIEKTEVSAEVTGKDGKDLFPSLSTDELTNLVKELKL